MQFLPLTCPDIAAGGAGRGRMGWDRKIGAVFRLRHVDSPLSPYISAIIAMAPEQIRRRFQRFCTSLYQRRVRLQGRSKTHDAITPTANVAAVPIRTYQVKAMGVAKRT